MTDENLMVGRVTIAATAAHIRELAQYPMWCVIHGYDLDNPDLNDNPWIAARNLTLADAERRACELAVNYPDRHYLVLPVRLGAVS